MSDVLPRLGRFLGFGGSTQRSLLCFFGGNSCWVGVKEGFGFFVIAVRYSYHMLLY